MLRKENTKKWEYTPNGILLNPIYRTSFFERVIQHIIITGKWESPEEMDHIGLV
jgi:hypothetical protein